MPDNVFNFEKYKAAAAGQRRLARRGGKTARQRFHDTAAEQKHQQELAAGIIDEDGVRVDATPVPQRISAALDLRELYGPDVDTACGAAEPDVDEWELGISVPTREQVRLLAKLTDFPIKFFYKPWKPLPGPIVICGRRCEWYEPEPLEVRRERYLAERAAKGGTPSALF